MTARYRRQICGRIIGVWVLLMAASALQFPTAAQARSQGIRALGVLATSPSEAPSVSGVVGFDPPEHALLYLWLNQQQGVFYLREFDLRHAVPTIIRDIRIGPLAQFSVNYLSPYLAAIDIRHQVLYFLGAGGVPADQIQSIDLRRGKVGSVLSLATFVPGFTATGVTYAPQ